MELTYQGLRILLPFEGAIGVEAFTLEASFNQHVYVEIMLLVDEDAIETAIHEIADGDSIAVYGEIEEMPLFSGKITDSGMVNRKGLCFLTLKAVSHTAQWDLVPESRSFQNPDASYGQVMQRVLENLPEAEIMDCVTDGATTGGFLLQYEESGWEFLVRLASCFGTFLVPDCRAEHGRAYFGIPELGEECVLDGEDYEEMKDMDRYYRIGCMAGILPQEHMGWEITARCDLCLAMKVQFKGISTIVTGIHYETINGELVRTYGLSRRRGYICAPKKNPHIFGMGIPATVKERSGNCVRVHFDIDSEYDASPNTLYFAYAIESSFIYCMPEAGSRVHVYFPSDDERDAYAVHAIRTSGAGSSGYAQNPDCKSFSNVDGAELLLTPSSASLSSDQEQGACLYLGTDGNAYIEGKTVEIHAEKNLSLGEPAEEGEIPVAAVEMEAEILTMQVGEDGAQIKLTQEAEIIAEFVKMEATEVDLSDSKDPNAPRRFYKKVVAGDSKARSDINTDAEDRLVENYVNGRTDVLEGTWKIVTTAAAVAFFAAATVSTAGAAAVAIVGGIVITAADADIGEGIDSMEKTMNGSLERGYNYLRDNFFGGDEDAYEAFKDIADIAFGVVSAKALANLSIVKFGKFACGGNKLKTAKAAVQVFMGVGNNAANQLIYTGKVDPRALAFNAGTGILQGYLGSSMTGGILGAFGMQDSKLLGLLLGTVVDTELEGFMSALFEMPFDSWESLGRNGFANLFAILVKDPVDAATGAYIIRETDSILASLPSALKLERIYRSTQKTDSVFGRGWSFSYASRIFRDTQDAKNLRIHMHAVTGHSLCYEKQDGAWVSRCRGTSRFVLEVREGAGYSETETFLLTDVMEHTVYVYDREGRLSYVEYPNRLKLVLSYGTDGLERITTPLGNVLEIQSREGRILQITDEIGRCTRYRYAGDFLTDVVHADEGITHYEYDSNGHIISVTDQNGSRYIENEYDQKGRITRQGFTSGVYQIFSYDDAHRRNTIYYSETGTAEVYEYNENLLVERIIYEDGTHKAFTYSGDNMKISETGRMGNRTEWEYDAYGRTIREKSPDGYEMRHEYDQNHDLVRTLDSDGRETQCIYDQNHNLTLLREKISSTQWKETAKAYDAKGRCISEKDALGNETVMEYDDNRAYPRRVITPKGEETAYTYDRVGRRMSIGNVYGTVELAYNSRNFVTKRTDGEGNTWHQFYDRMGKLTASFTPKQWEDKSGWEYRYDFLSRVEDTISPLKEHKRVFRNFDGEIINEIHSVSYAEKGEDGEGTRYEYDIYGNCIRIRYADGGIERRFYDADGNMVKQIQPESYDAAIDNGEGYHYAYDACGRMTQVQDPDGNVLHAYEYNGHGQIIRETDGEGKEILYIYNALGWKVREQLKIKDVEIPLYRVTAYTYDSQGNKVEEAYGQQEVQKDGEPESWHKICFSYDKNNHLTLVKDDFGAQVRYDYDCLGNVTLEERIIEEGTPSTVRYGYNKNGMCIQRTEKIQGNGEVKCAVTKYAYDADGNLTQIITPKGFEIRREYDADGRMVQERVIDKKNGIDRRERYAYDEAGNIVESTVLGADGERFETRFKYDLKDRLTRRTEPSGASVRYIHDRNDRLLKEIGPYGYQPENDGGAGMSYVYDSRGNRIKTVNALNETVQEQIYNLQDLPKTQTDANGNRTDFDYEADGQLKEVRRGNSIRRNPQRTLQKYEYNATGQITGIIDGNHNRISYDVDGWGRITGVGFADGVKEGYGYTPAGQVSRTVDGNGNIIQYRYNSFGKVSERTDQLGYKETYQYDEEGNLVLHTDRDRRRLQCVCNVFGDPVYEKATDADGKNPCISTWHYDSIGRLVRAVSDGHSYEYIYNEYGNLKEKRSNGKRLVSYTHDAAGQITEIKDPAGIVTKYEYDIMGRQSRIYNDSGLEVRYNYDALNRISHIKYGNSVETTYAYDADGNISGMETKAGENVLLSFTYEYDGNGNRTAKTGMQMTAGSSALDISYDYDVRGQLLKERRNDASVRYAYDKAGNRVRKTDARGEIRYFYNAKNQLLREETEDAEKQFTYDRQGGIIKETNPSGIRRFAYDSRHRQTKVETEDGNVQENRYDVENLRFELLENGKRTQFIYHDGELLHEEGGKENGQTGYHLGAGIEAFTRAEETYYYQQDEQLSTVFITGKNGAVHNSYQYDAFGNELEIVGDSNRIRYTGQQYDDATGQYYLRARYYNPVLGRFMQEDNYWGDGLSLYTYCSNNPVLYYDPSGFASDSLLPNELQFGIFSKLKNLFKTAVTRLTPHHMVSAEYMRRKYGVRPEDGLAMLLETTHYNSGGRHGKTATYGGISSDYYDLTPRQALAHDLFDMRKLLKEKGLYDDYAKKQLIGYAKAQQEMEYSTSKKYRKDPNFTGKIITNEKIFSKEYEDNLNKVSVC